MANRDRKDGPIQRLVQVPRQQCLPHPQIHQQRTIMADFDWKLRLQHQQYPAPIGYDLHYYALVAHCLQFVTPEGKPLVGGQDDADAIRANGGDKDLYCEAFQLTSYLRRVFVSEKGRLGLAPRSAKEGDEIIVIAGGRVPFVMRKVEESEEYEMIAECYLHGIMDGELVEAEGFGWEYVTVT